MSVIRTASVALTILLLTASLPAQQQQSAQPPELPPPPTYLRIDDQFFDVTDTPGARAGSIARPQGGTVDSNAFGWRFKYAGWDAGVVPIEFAPEVTDAHRAQVMRLCEGWGRITPVSCVARTSQLGYLRVIEDVVVQGACTGAVGQARRLVQYQMSLPTGCYNDRNIYHELGHVLGFIHEHQRPDRDKYLSIDFSNIRADVAYAFTTVPLVDPLGPYDFLSIMHYGSKYFATDTSRFTMLPQAGYASYALTMGTSAQPSDLDHVALQNLYAAYLRPLQSTAPAESPRTRFDRNDFLDAMERLHAFYYSRMGLNRTAGLSIGGRPDFAGIATWIFDVYLAARSRGFSAEQSFGMVVADITRTDEWRGKHPGQTPLTRPSFNPVIAFDRNEFLNTLQQLDAFYAAREGLQRPEGLSISGGPDFLGIATWIFDGYLNERLSGGSPNVAWQRVVNAIQNTEEWKRKH